MAEDAVVIVEDPAAAVERAVELTPPSGQVIVTGTLYLVGAARAQLVPEPDPAASRVPRQ
jgi:hypothetical protein